MWEARAVSGREWDVGGVNAGRVPNHSASRAIDNDNGASPLHYFVATGRGRLGDFTVG